MVRAPALSLTLLWTTPPVVSASPTPEAALSLGSPDAPAPTALWGVLEATMCTALSSDRSYWSYEPDVRSMISLTFRSLRLSRRLFTLDALAAACTGDVTTQSAPFFSRVTLVFLVLSSLS